jgi:opacity protein-like surface antigen
VVSRILPIALLAIALSACAATAAQQAAAAPSSGHANQISVFVGNRSMHDDDWDPVDDQTVLGIGYDTKLSSLPFEFEAAVARSKDESGSVEGITRELSAGLRKTFDVGDARFHPYVGAGIGLIRAEVEAPGPDDDDTSIGVYLHGGLGYDLSENWQVGLDLRFLVGSDIDLNGNSMDADYTQFAVYVGYSF